MLIRILTNARFLTHYESDVMEMDYRHLQAKDVISNLKFYNQYDAILLNSLGMVTYLFLLLKFFKLISAKIFVLDPIFVKPKNIMQAWMARFKGLLLNTADALFIYAKNNTGVRKYFHIGHWKMVYVPFKVNGLELIVSRYQQPVSEGYVFSGGRSRRDYATLIKAAKNLPNINFKITCPDEKELLQENSTIYSDKLPNNVELIHDNGTLEEFLDVMSKSEIVVLPVIADNIAPAGISVYLNAMALRRPVIITKGPAVDDIITAEMAVMVDPENDARLREEIDSLYHDSDKKKRLAENAFRYAMSLGDESDLFHSIESAMLEFFTGRITPAQAE